MTGSQGWKLRPARDGKPEVKPFSGEEVEYARMARSSMGHSSITRPKGVAVTLEGLDEVEGNKAWRLLVKLPSGASHHVWIDSQSFLDIKSDRESRQFLRV